MSRQLKSGAAERAAEAHKQADQFAWEAAKKRMLGCKRAELSPTPGDAPRRPARDEQSVMEQR